jgi:hypothetical protein
MTSTMSDDSLERALEGAVQQGDLLAAKAVLQELTATVGPEQTKTILARILRTTPQETITRLLAAA